MLHPKKLRRAFAMVEDEIWEFRSFLKGQDEDEVDKLARQLHKELFGGYDCIACSNCCKDIIPEIDEREIRTISEKLGMEKEEFKNRYLVKNEDGNYEINKKPCPFLTEKGCSIYEFRPKNCREYPYTNKKHFTERLINLIAQCEVCPIVFEIFQRLKEHYEYELNMNGECFLYY